MTFFLRDEPSRGIGGETDKCIAFARRAALPSGGNTVNITEDVRKYAAEQAITEEEALTKGLAEKANEFNTTGAELYAKA